MLFIQSFPPLVNAKLYVHFSKLLVVQLRFARHLTGSGNRSAPWEQNISARLYMCFASISFEVILMRFPLCEEGGLNKVQSADSDSGSLASAGEYTLELYWVGE